MKLILFLILSTILFISPYSFSQGIPSSSLYKSLHTPHFEILFDSEQQDLAEHYAKKLEYSYNYLSNYLTDKPEKTIVIINDNTDLTNGYATRLPYPHIMIYPVLPPSGDSLGEIGDWPLEVLTHEYVHILSFEPVGDQIKFLRSIFGSIVAPNLLLPNWWKEGVAVLFETKIGHHGRLRSIYQDAIIRTLVAESKLLNFDLSEVNDSTPFWPEGMRPYIFGSLLWSQMEADHGDKTSDYLFQRHGERIPYFINEPAQEIFGNDYNIEFKKMLIDVDQRAQKQLNLLNQSPLTFHQKLNISTLYTNHPSVSPNGQNLAIISVDQNKIRTIQILSRTSDGSFKKTDTIENKMEADTLPKANDAPPGGSINHTTWFHHKNALLFDKVEAINQFQNFSDFWIYDLHEKKISKLTTGLRGREANLSPNDKKVCYIKMDGARTHLALLDLESKKSEILFTPPLFERLSHPIFWNDQTIIYSHRNQNGQEGLYTHDLTTKKRQQILSSYKQAQSPSKTPYGLLFISSNNGTFNLYLADPSFKQASPLTHTDSAILNGSIDPLNKNLYATVLTSKGPQVHIYLEKDWKKTPKVLPEIQPLFSDRYPNSTTAKNLKNQEPEKLVSEIKNYRSSDYLLPRYWTPFINMSTQSNGLLLSAQTSGFDPLKRHLYDFSASIDLSTGYGNLLGSYRNNTTDIPFSVGGSKLTTISATHELIGEDNSYWINGHPSLFKLSPNLVFSGGWNYSESQFSSLKTKSMGPSAFLLFQNYARAGLQISPESGYGYFIGHTEHLQHEDFLHYSKSKASLIYFHSKGLPLNHAIMMKISGLYIPQSFRNSYLFGSTNTTAFPAVDSAIPSFVMRGYRVSQFYGSKVFNMNLEYRLPVSYIYKGEGTRPFFSESMYLSTFLDAATLEGMAFNDETLKYHLSKIGTIYWGAGLELKLDSTVGYLLPITWVLGSYWGFNTGTSQALQLYLGIQMAVF